MGSLVKALGTDLNIYYENDFLCANNCFLLRFLLLICVPHYLVMNSYCLSTIYLESLLPRWLPFGSLRLTMGLLPVSGIFRAPLVGESDSVWAFTIWPLTSKWSLDAGHIRWIWVILKFGNIFNSKWNFAHSSQSLSRFTLVGMINEQNFW